MENFEKALNIRLAIFGENHPGVATCYNNIGSVYYSQGDYTRALENHGRALNIWLAIFGENHPNVATYYNNIGLVYSSQEDYTRALDNHERALNIRLAIFGENHPDVATCYNNIGSVYYSQGDYTRALENYERALKIRLGIFGEIHPDVTISQTLIYSSFHKLLQIDEKKKDRFDLFMRDKALIGTISGDNTPTGKIGLKGEYMIFSFGDWNFDDQKNLFDVNTEVRGKPKDLTLYKDGEISEHHFENQIGMEIGLKVVGVEKKKQIEEAYKKWKGQ